MKRFPLLLVVALVLVAGWTTATRRLPTTTVRGSPPACLRPTKRQ